MSSTTNIEWARGDDGAAGATWNPVTGCDELSEGCDNCYAKTFAERWRGVPGHPFEQGFDIKLWPDRLALPLRWRKPRRIFVNSMSDLFHNAVPTEFIAKVFAVMTAAPQHTFQVLTKRHGRMASLLTSAAFWEAVSVELGRLWGTEPPAPLRVVPPWIWIGVSVENQHWAQTRLPKLAMIPAAVRFASCEPLLGPVDLRAWLGHGLDWVIAGGESGPRARPMHPEWAMALRGQCQDAGVPFFFKQWGQFTPESACTGRDSEGTPRGSLAIVDSHGGSWTQTPADAPADAVRMRRVGKGRAGRILDGRTWDEFPTVRDAATAP